MSGNEEVFTRLREVVRRTFAAANRVEIERSTTSADIDGWDSLSHSILIMNVEDAFGVDLPLDAVYSLVDLGALADLIESALSNTGSK